MFRHIKTLQDVVDWRLCTGCGACISALQAGEAEMQNSTVGNRPVFKQNVVTDHLVQYCPGLSLNGTLAAGSSIPIVHDDFGGALEIWEGYATDPQIRRYGSSGGVISALAVYCLECEGMSGVVHAGMDEQNPWLNKTYLSTNREEILKRSGSRYSPASPGEGLRWIAEGKGQSVFIGKPCDTAGATMFRQYNPELDKKLGLTISLVCAGTPSTKGTLEYLKKLEINEQRITSIRYRGDGWPGGFTVCSEDKDDVFSPYSESWDALNRFVPFRCRICPDGIGRLADITCGDAWHRYTPGDSCGEGTSIIIVRTKRGKEILHKASEAGYLKIVPSTANDVLNAQRGLTGKRRIVWGRLFAMRLLAIPTPRFKEYGLFRSWNQQSLGSKIKSIGGTMKRLLARGLWHRSQIGKDDWGVR